MTMKDVGGGKPSTDGRSEQFHISRVSVKLSQRRRATTLSDLIYGYYLKVVGEN